MQGVRQSSNPKSDPSAVDPEDFQAFVESRGTHLYRSACLLTCGDSHLAEDLVQETLGRMYAKWGRVSRIDNPSGYAQTTLFNLFISMRRRKSSGERPSEQLPESAGGGTDVVLRLTLLAALAQLPAVDRAVVVLRFWEDRSIEETATALKLSGSAVRSRTFRAMGRLRELLGADFPELVEK
jgi:RNA polymerase sigma-70 factor (sigma-E family)